MSERCLCDHASWEPHRGGCPARELTISERIRDAEAAVIAAADKAEAADAAIDGGHGSYSEAAYADRDLYAAVRALREARKP